MRLVFQREQKNTRHCRNWICFCTPVRRWGGTYSIWPIRKDYSVPVVQRMRTEIGPVFKSCFIVSVHLGAMDSGPNPKAK